MGLIARKNNDSGKEQEKTIQFYDYLLKAIEIKNVDEIIESEKEDEEEKNKEKDI